MRCLKAKAEGTYLPPAPDHACNPDQPHARALISVRLMGL